MFCGGAFAGEEPTSLAHLKACQGLSGLGLVCVEGSPLFGTENPTSKELWNIGIEGVAMYRRMSSMGHYSGLSY